MGIILIALLVLAVILALLYIYFSWNFNYWNKRGVKGPKPQIVYGTLPSAISQKRNIVYDYVDSYNNYKKTEKFIGHFSTRTPELMVLTPDLSKEVHVSKFRQFQDNSFAYLFNMKEEPLFNVNPFMLKGQEWKEKRAEITPALTSGRIKASYPVMQKVGSKFIDFIKKMNEIEGKGYAFDCKELTQRYTIQNVSDSVYGIDAGALETDKESELFKQATKLMVNLFEGAATYFIFSSIPLVGKMMTKKIVLKETEDFFIKLIHDAIELRETADRTNRIDFLNYLLQLRDKKGYTEMELLAFSLTFFLDGFDTSATLMAHAILCLGRDKNVQNKLRLEIEKHVEEDGTISFENLQDLQYLNQCINETLRIFPPGSFSQKMCVEDTEFTNADGRVLKVEKGTTVTVPIYCFHNDEDIFPNPNKFDPDRFSLENGGEKKYREMGAFIPFGDGPRTCLGQRFALIQIKVALAELVRNFEIRVDDRTRKDNLLDRKHFFLYLDGGIWCSFTELKN